LLHAPLLIRQKKRIFEFLDIASDCAHIDMERFGQRILIWGYVALLVLGIDVEKVRMENLGSI